MKFLFTADIHLSRYGQDKIEETSNLPERLHSIKNVLYFMGNYARKNEISSIVIGGDILHGKSIIYTIAQDLMLQFFKDFEDITFWIIDGNHDLSGKGKDAISALRPLETVNNVVWITKTNLHYANDENSADIMFVPYTYDVAKEVKHHKATILVSHFGLNEGVLNSGISVVSDVKMNDLAGKYKLVLLGHYHKPQDIGNEEIKLSYVGSPIQLDWGEKNDAKRFLVVDTKTLDVQSIPLVGYKKHIELEVTQENKLEVLKLAKKELENGNYVKILKKDEVDTKGMESFNVVDKSEKVSTQRGITSTMSRDDKFRKYLEIKKIYQEKHPEYMEVAVSIIDSCEGETE